MCGIVAYLGHKAAQPILIEGLKRLEYRGYDSAGVALLAGDTFIINKTAGRITALEEILPSQVPENGLRNRPYPMGNPRPAKYPKNAPSSHRLHRQDYSCAQWHY